VTDAAELDRRVTALETAQNETTQTLRWTVAKIGRIAAVQDEHTLRLERIETRLDGLQNEFSAFRRDLPVIIADVMRGVLKEHGK
jgi:hypothetical protein